MLAAGLLVKARSWALLARLDLNLNVTAFLQGLGACFGSCRLLCRSQDRFTGSARWHLDYSLLFLVMGSGCDGLDFTGVRTIGENSPIAQTIHEPRILKPRIFFHGLLRVLRLEGHGLIAFWTVTGDGAVCCVNYAH